MDREESETVFSARRVIRESPLLSQTLLRVRRNKKTASRAVFQDVFQNNVNCRFSTRWVAIWKYRRFSSKPI